DPPPPRSALPTYTTLCRSKAGEEMQIGSMDIEVLHPASLSGSDDLNRDSLSLRFTYGDISFVFTGDAYKEDEQAMMANASSVERSEEHTSELQSRFDIVCR